MLYFGSFNPVHRGHIELAEYVLDQQLCDSVVLIVSPQNPLKRRADLAPELDRFEMAEIACAASRYPERIKPSAVEFLLDRPSYTIDTLRHLSEHYGDRMRFSVLMGADAMAQIGLWKEPERLLSDYPVYVYPRRDTDTDGFPERIVYLEGAPLTDWSSTAIREALERGEDPAGVHPAVLRHIRARGLYTLAARMAALTAQLDEAPDAALYVERGMLRYRRNEWGEALNDFRRALEIDPSHEEAKQFTEMVQEILAFRYKDIYNP